MILRPYQNEAKVVTRQEMAAGRNPLVIMATGLGKTVVFGSLALDWAADGKRTIAFAHKRDLIHQTAAKVQALDPMADVGIVMQKQREYHFPIVVASRDSIRGKRLDELRRHPFDYVIIDESHRAACKGYRDISDVLREANPEVRFLYVTATASRADQQSLITEGLASKSPNTKSGAAFERDLGWGIENGYLVPLVGRRYDTHVDLTGLKTSRSTGDYKDNELSPLIDTDERNGLVVESWRGDADGRPTVAFCVDVAHATHLAEMYAALGVPAAHVSYKGGQILDKPLLPTSQTKVYDATRDEIRAASKRGDIAVVTNPMLLGEGSDWPWLECVQCLTPISELAIGKYAQQVGRGTRLSPETGKVDCLVQDFADNTRHDLSKLSDLLDGGAAIEEREKAKAKAKQQAEEDAEKAKAKAKQQAEDDAEKAKERKRHVGLVITSAEVAILAKQSKLNLDTGKGAPLPPLRWVDCGPVGGVQTAALSLDDQSGTLVLYPAVAGGAIEYRVALVGKATDGRVMCTVGRGDTPQEASADARERVGAMGLKYTPTAFWRRNQATDRQVNALGVVLRAQSGDDFWTAKARAQALAQGHSCGDVSAWLGYLSAAREWAKQEAA